MASILVVDDDDSIRVALGEILRRFGHDVRDADDGASALTMCRESIPDLALIDMYMPGQDGIETIRAFRKEVPDVKIIAMSGEQLGGNVGVLQMASMLGAVEILRKPFELDEVIAAVTNALGG